MRRVIVTLVAAVCLVLVSSALARPTPRQFAAQVARTAPAPTSRVSCIAARQRHGFYICVIFFKRPVAGVSCLAAMFRQEPRHPNVVQIDPASMVHCSPPHDLGGSYSPSA